MYGLINRSIQCFVEDTYGPPLWDMIARDARLETRDFEAMLRYPDAVTDQVLHACADHLDKSVDAVLEDVGSYLVTHRNMESVRRLLRFGGHCFEEFLHSLDDLHDRAKLAVPDLELPLLEVEDFKAQHFALQCRWSRPGFGPVMLGILRAMADDYGALVLLDLDVTRVEDGVKETVRIEILEADFSQGRTFKLAGMA